MNLDQKTIFSYSGPGLLLTVLCLALLAAALLCAFFSPQEASPAPVPFDSIDESADGAVYLDVVGISDAMYPNASGRYYYLVEDSYHLFAIACMTQEEYESLEAQRLYWNNPESAEEAAHLTGVSLPIPESVRDSVVTLFEMDAESFDNNFGTRCFFTRAPETGGGRSAVWTVFAVLFLLGFLGTLLLWLYRFFGAWSAVSRLEEDGRLAQAVDELLGPQTALVRGDRLRLGEGFAFGWRCGLAAAWEDVIWCYGRSIKLFGQTLALMLVIATADGKSHALFFSPGERKALRLVAQELSEHNQAMLLGNSAANRAAWKKACR